jgi:hypothetical protein
MNKFRGRLEVKDARNEVVDEVVGLTLNQIRHFHLNATAKQIFLGPYRMLNWIVRVQAFSGSHDSND